MEMGVGCLRGVGGYLGDEEVGGRDGGVDDVGHFFCCGWVCFCWFGWLVFGCVDDDW